MEIYKIASMTCRKFTESVNLEIEFEKQLNSLKALTVDTEEYENINSLVAWNRNEFAKRPEKFTGDHIPIKMVKNNVAAGYSLDLAIQETHRVLKYKFAVIDTLRALGK